MYESIPSKCALCRIFDPRSQYKYTEDLNNYYNEMFFDYPKSELRSLLNRIKGQPVHSECLKPLKSIQRSLHRDKCVCRCADYYIHFPELNNECDNWDLQDGYPPIHFLRVEPKDCSICKSLKEWRKENKDKEEMNDKDKVLYYMNESHLWIVWSSLENGTPRNRACSEHIQLVQETLQLDKDDPEKTSIL